MFLDWQDLSTNSQLVFPSATVTSHDIDCWFGSCIRISFVSCHDYAIFVWHNYRWHLHKWTAEWVAIFQPNEKRGQTPMENAKQCKTTTNRQTNQTNKTNGQVWVRRKLKSFAKGKQTVDELRELRANRKLCSNPLHLPSLLSPLFTALWMGIEIGTDQTLRMRRVTDA